MNKNIIICCDGTGNQFGEENSNVVKLYTVIGKNQRQITYYDPGVGTISDASTSLGKKVSILKGLAFGTGLRRNVMQAYFYLMDNYNEGDKVFLFGFSRGAYTVRILAAFIHMCGLLHKGNNNLFPYAYSFFEKKNFKLANKFKFHYGQPIPIHFLGVWDTVSSYGWIGKWKNYPYTAKNTNILNVRHAISIDEKRTYYKQNLLNEKAMPNSDVKQVWFAGVHSDIGGSYPEEDSGLSKITLQWMLVEAKEKGLAINFDLYKEVVLGEKKEYAVPDSDAKMHKSLKRFWWTFEIFPRKIYNPILNRKRSKLPLGTRRFISEGALIHQSVFDRKEDGNYSPANMPSTYVIEPYTEMKYENELPND